MSLFSHLYCHILFVFCIFFVLNYLIYGNFSILFCLTGDLLHGCGGVMLLSCTYCMPVLLPRVSHPNALRMVMYSRSGLAVFRLYMFECDCCEFMVVLVCGARLKICFCLRKPKY